MVETDGSDIRSRRMREHGRVGSVIVDSNDDKQIYHGGRIDVDILVGISDWKN